MSVPHTFSGRQSASVVELDADFASLDTRVTTLEGEALQVASAQLLAGLTLSNDAGAPGTTIDVDAGGCNSDEANLSARILLQLVAPLRGTTAGLWVVGDNQPKLDAGAVAASTWYHVWVIKRVDTGVTDLLFSLSATAPALPAFYTRKRRIGSFRTDGASAVVPFVQDGDNFLWLTTVLDANLLNPGTAAISVTLTVPTGVHVWAQLMETVFNAGVGGSANSLVSDLAVTDADPSTVADVAGIETVAGRTATAVALKSVRTNLAGQVRARLSFSDANVSLALRTYGWIDRRGQDA